MQATGEIKSAVNNLRYYVKTIADLLNRQFELDMESYKLGEKVRENVLTGSIRFNCSGEIAASCAKIAQHCQSIEAQVKIMEEQDAKR